MSRAIRWVVLTCCLVGSGPLAAHPLEVRDLTTLRKRLGVERYDEIPATRERLKDIKIAILDNGFGAPPFRDRVLPASLFTLVSRYDRALIEKYHLGDPDRQAPLDERADHGMRLALITWAVTGFHSTFLPKFYLLNARGLTNLERAVRYAIENKIDIILYSQNWEYGGNFDGRGFINRIVSYATRAGILWVNAAGNYGGRVFNGGVSTASTGWVSIGPDGNGLRFKNRLDNNTVKVLLSWNSYSEEESNGTDKDLDLYVYDEAERVAAKSDLQQIKGGPGVVRRDGQTFVPRESIEVPLDRNVSGTYRIRVADRTRNFGGADKLRITVMGTESAYYDATERKLVEPVELLDATKGSEVMVPADHPEVFAVGDLTVISAKGPTADGRAKPDLTLTNSEAEFTDGRGTSGTSNAAAMFAGVLALMKAHAGVLTRENILRYVTQVRSDALQDPGPRYGMETLGSDALRRAHPRAFGAIERLLDRGVYFPAPVVVAGRYPNNGPYAVVVSQSPLELRRGFPGLPAVGRDAGRYDVYLQTRGDDSVVAYARDRQRPAGAPAEAWEATLQRFPEQFVHVVMARAYAPTEGGELIPLWTTPTPQR